MTESFTYILHSGDAKKDGANYYFDFGNLSTSSDKFLIEVMSATINQNVNTNLGFLMLIADDLADSGIYTQNKLSSNQCLMTAFNVTIGSYEGNNDVFFTSKNLRMIRNVKMTLKRPDFTDAVVGTDIDVGGNTIFCLMLKFTPLKDDLIRGGSGLSLIR